MLGQIVYPVGNKNGCEAFPKQLQGQDAALPIILLVARGDCYFIEKVWLWLPLQEVSLLKGADAGTADAVLECSRRNVSAHV